ncbi:MAG: OmpA family protein [Rhodobacteraceae bacterium]|nr:OmpA family protein [Paracoccaceae bacterium]
MRLAGFLTGALILAVPEAARADDPQPHPLVPLAPDAEITDSAFVDFTELTFPSGPFEDRDPTAVLEKQGAHLRQEYRIDGTEVATVRLYQSYLEYFEGQGFELVFHGMDDELRDGGSARRFLRDGLDAPAGRRSDAFGYILARAPSGDHVVAMSFYDRRGDRRIQVDVLEIDEMETFDLFADEAAPEEEAEPEEFVPSTQDAAALESGLVDEGRVVVDAILFAFDDDEILPESADALETVASLMDENAGLDLLVVGHTDGVGSFDYNLRLSLERAQAVVAWLSDAHGIAEGRLRPAGAGPMSPITTNRSEDGRAQNRRVELVEVID